MKNKTKFTARFFLFQFILLMLFLSSLSVNAFAESKMPQAQKALFFPAKYDFSLITDTITMPDGIKLSVTYYKPRELRKGEKFPIVLEVLPYRKDDSFYVRDYKIYCYLARRGIAVARVDIRGTGSSEGKLPDREYSDIELDDIINVIEYLSKLPWSNGNIGMQGNSWSAFNAIMTAMRRPPQLKAILISHGSEDLFYNDIHFIDGALHINEYALEMETENPVPRSPDYPVDEDFFINRFETEPWIFTYIRHQRDGGWWRKGRSLFTDYKAINIPCYIIGGLLDGYRDYVPNMLENVNAPIKAEIGPWNHDFPFKGFPGPNYENRQTAVRWWQQWLNNIDTGVMDEPRLMVFMRGAVAPDTELKTTEGGFWSETWPIERTKYAKYYPQKSGELLENKPEITAVNSLKYIPDTGAVAGPWWGEPTGDFQYYDRDCLVYDTPIIDKISYLLGMPKVKLRVCVDAPLANFVVRLEDVFPDGKVSLITGGLINGAYRESRIDPKPLEPGKFYDIEIPMHFTTWTLTPGHKLRLAVTNAQFPMLWPTPCNMTMRVSICGESFLELPLVEKRIKNDKSPVLLFPEEIEYPPDSSKPEGEGPTLFEVTKDKATGITSASSVLYGSWELKGRHYKYHEKITYSVNVNNPAYAGCEGVGTYEIKTGKRIIKVKSIFEVKSDLNNFTVTANREIYENDKLIKRRVWRDVIPRDLH